MLSILHVPTNHLNLLYSEMPSNILPIIFCLFVYLLIINCKSSLYILDMVLYKIHVYSFS